MPEKIRAFIAIELKPAIKNKISEIQSELQKVNADVKWIEQKNIHLTLKFLGSIEEEKVEKIKQIIEAASKNYPQFEIQTSNIGFFPEKGMPRVVWIGIEKNKDILEKIVKDLEEKIRELGIPKETRAFKSHAAIGRVKSSKNKNNLIAKINEINQGIKTETQNVSEIILFQSTLTQTSPIYNLIYKAQLI